MNTKDRNGRRQEFTGNLLAVAAALIFVAASTGCQSVNHLREAQDSFSQAAAAENAARLDLTQTTQSPADSLAGMASARSGYASALLSLTQLAGADEAKLKQDKLWGTALTLKALCEWRLGRADALTTAEQALNAGDQLFPRDRALMTALPGLILTDQAYAKTLRDTATTNAANRQAEFTEVERMLVGDNGAIARIERARALVEPDHPIQVYFVQAELAAFRNYSVARRRYGLGTLSGSDLAYVNAKARLAELEQMLPKIEPGPNADALVGYWRRLCGL